MSKRIGPVLFVMLLIVMTTFVAGGCGGGGGDDPKDKAGTTTTGGTTTGGTTSGTTTSGGTNTGGNNGGDFTRSVRGVLDRVDRVVSAIQLIRVALKVVSTAGRAEGDTIQTVTPAADGTYQFQNVPLGNYEVVITAPDGSVQPVQIPISVTQAQESVEVPRVGVVPSNVEIDRIEIVLPASTLTQGQTYTFTAKVITKTGQEIAGWQPLWAVEGGIGTVNNEGQFTAVSLGSGRIVASFNIGKNKVEFKTPEFTVVDGQTPAPTLFVTGNTPGSSYGVFRINSRTKQGLGNIEIPDSNSSIRCTVGADGALFVVFNEYKSVQQFRPDGSLGYVIVGTNDGIEDVVVLPSGNVLTASVGTRGLWVWEKNTGISLSAATQDMFKASWSSIYDMKVGRDGKLYIAGTKNSSHYVRRYNIGAGDVLESESEVISVSSSGGSRYTGIAFASNGDMILLDDKADTLQRFTTSGGPLGGAFPVADIIEGSIAIGSSVNEPGDEVLFVVVANGVRRIKFSGGNFTALDSENLFVANSTAYDVAVF